MVDFCFHKKISSQKKWRRQIEWKTRKIFLFLLVGYHTKSFLLLQPYYIDIISQHHPMVLSWYNLNRLLFVWEVMRFLTPLVSVFKMIFHIMFFHMNIMFLFYMKSCIKFWFEIFCIECDWYYLFCTYWLFFFHMKMLCYFIWHIIHMKSYMHASPLDESSWCHFYLKYDDFHVKCVIKLCHRNSRMMGGG